MKMGPVEVCPSGSAITTQEECESALHLAEDFGITLAGRTSLISGSWSNVPSGCSYQAGGDNAFHFNSRTGITTVANFNSGFYGMICKKGKYMLNPRIFI